MSDVSAPQAGWYADPENPAGERWWNGSGWSEHKRDSTDTAAIPPVVPPPATPPPVVTPPATTTGVAAPGSVPIPPAAVADSAGFTFGSPAPATSGPRPDPYAPPAPGVAATYYSLPYVGAPYGAPGYGSGTNGLALAGLLVSSVGWLVLSIVGPIVGIILSAFGLRAAKQREAAGNPNSGRGLAMAGLIIGIVIGSIAALLIIVLVVASVASYPR